MTMQDFKGSSGGVRLIELRLRAAFAVTRSNRSNYS
jgi:hypothetical protein